MSVICEPTAIPDVCLFTPQVHGDARGFFLQTYQTIEYAAAGLDRVFVQDNLSRSRRDTVRGLHYQLRHPQAKLVSVMRGAVLDVAVDIRRGSPTFGTFVVAELSEENRHQLYIPEGFAHGFRVLSESADFFYKCTDHYAPGDEYGVRWNDPALAIPWGDLSTPVVSTKDQQLPRLADVPPDTLPEFKRKEA
ncbi:MAG: dTDP-4-dehydrorhamnose 3,5-epimerase [Kiritimatiellae bacterium]|jgi:dTDP-4-dehydrorhamnose 3,5-epimerase|nr:dTDP-4-dehydrorhamnose 3,5-epimerase [Kiritimatiellia bacterium]MDD4342000.1 dTDP-4-dehydrorhamnose 3,5-epimerase [Kiritimatiellia bacterium]MDY0148825.1 dTDP-4-dehydrorhamnose 3,5-epimerase [Kiritimatiellia bacterium]